MANANWSNPTLTSTYTNFLSEVKNRDEDLALQFDGTTSTNLVTNTIRWDSSANRWKKWNGSAWVELASTYALTGLSTTGNASIGGTLGVTGAITLTAGGTSTTPATDNNSTNIATTAYVVGQAAATAPGMDGTAAVGTSLRYARQDHVHPTDTTRAPLASPTFTGTVTIPAGASISGYAPLASPTFTGTVTIPNGASISGYLTTSSASSTYAPLASPALTGTPTAPTATAGTNTTQIATTAFVVANAITSAGGTLTGDLTVPSLNGGQLAGTRNRVINGSMAIDQRNSGAAQTFTAAAALAYSVDRWYGYCTGANVTGQRVQGATAGQYRYQFTGAASVTGIGFGQRIEQLNSAFLAGTTATLGVDLANSVLTSVTWTAYYATTADSFGTLASPTRTQIATGTFTVTSTVTRYSTQISVPAAATTGIEIVFSVGAQTSGTWTIGNVQFEPGTIATPFERRSYGQELALCQRYYEQVGSNVVGSVVFGTSSLNQSSSVMFAYKATKRATPTITLVSSRGSVNSNDADFFTVSYATSVSPSALTALIGGSTTSSAEL